MVLIVEMSQFQNVFLEVEPSKTLSGSDTGQGKTAITDDFLWHQQVIDGRTFYDNESGGNPGYRREQVFKFEQTSVGVPGGHPTREKCM